MAWSVSDVAQRLRLALALWNGREPNDASAKNFTFCFAGLSRTAAFTANSGQPSGNTGQLNEFSKDRGNPHD
jgi:hypothetical protein